MVLTAVSLVPPLLSGASTATIVVLLVLHLVAAAVMVPALARSLRTCEGRAGYSRPASTGVTSPRSRA